MGTRRRREKRTFATIRRLPSGRYQVRYTGPDSVRRNAPRTFSARIDAEAWVVAKRREIDGELWKPDENKPQPITFAEYATNWLAHRQVAGRPLKARTRRHYEQILDGHLLPWFGAKQLAAITGRDVRAWYAVTLTDRPTMRAHAYSLLHTIMGTAVTDELIDANPCRIAGAGTAKRARTIRPASVAEIGALTAKMPDRLALAVSCASWLAMRLGEILELRRGDVDLEAGVIRIRRAVVRVGGRLVVDTPKSASGVRDVAIPPHLIDRFRDHLVAHTAPDANALLFGSGQTRRATCKLRRCTKTFTAPAPRLAGRTCVSMTCVIPALCWQPRPARRWRN